MGSYDLQPSLAASIKALSIADMLGANEIFVFLGHQTVYPICGQYSFGFITTLLDGKFPNLCTTDYKVSHGEAIRKITSNGYKLQVITSRGTHGDTYSLTPFEQTCYMPLILNFPVNMDLMVTHNVQGPVISFAKVMSIFWAFTQPTVLPYTRAVSLQLGRHMVPCSPVLSLNLINFFWEWILL